MSHANRSQGSVQPGEIFPGGPSRHLSLPGGRPPATAASTSLFRGPYVTQQAPAPPQAHRVHSAPAPGSYVGYSRAPPMAPVASQGTASPAAPIGGPFGYGPHRPELQAAPSALAPIGGPFGYGAPQPQAYRQPMVHPGPTPSRRPSAVPMPSSAPRLAPPGPGATARRWSDHSAAAPAPPAMYGQPEQGVSYGRAPPPLPPPPPPRLPTTPPLRSPLSPYPPAALYGSQAARAPLAPSAPPASSAEAHADDELARVLEISKRSYEADEVLRRQINSPVAPAPVVYTHTSEDEELARALEESLRSGPAPEIEPLPLYEPVAPSALSAPVVPLSRSASPHLPETELPYGFSASRPFSTAVQCSASDNALPVPIHPPPRTSSAASFAVSSSGQAGNSYGSARAPDCLSVSPLPSPLMATADQQQTLGAQGLSQSEAPFSSSGHQWPVSRFAQDDPRRQTTTSSSRDQPFGEAPGQSFALGTDDPHNSPFDGGFIWGQTTLQPPSLAPLSVQHGLPLPHHSKGAVYVIAPAYPDLLTSLFALSNTLIEGGEETRLAVQFVRMADADGEECVTILWIESGALEGDEDAGQPTPPRRTSTASSSLSTASASSSGQDRRPSGHRLPPPLSETLHPPVEPSTGTYSSAHLIFQHPAFATRSYPRPRPRPQSTLIALPASAGPLLAIGDLLAHLLGLTPYALSDALSLVSSDRRRPSASPPLMWSTEDRERFLALIKQHIIETADAAGLDDDDDDAADDGDRSIGGSGAGTSHRGGKREKERSKRRWIKEHLGGVGTGSLSRQSHPHFVHQDQQQGPAQTARPPPAPKREQVAEVAAFITPFAFPIDSPS